MTVWGIIGTRHGFDVEPVELDALDAGDILAIYETEAEADQARNRIILLREMMVDTHGQIIERERQHRAMLEEGEPAWLDSIRHEIAVRNRMLLATHEIAKPRGVAPGTEVKS